MPLLRALSRTALVHCGLAAISTAAYFLQAETFHPKHFAGLSAAGASPASHARRTAHDGGGIVPFNTGSPS